MQSGEGQCQYRPRNACRDPAGPQWSCIRLWARYGFHPVERGHDRGRASSLYAGGSRVCPWRKGASKAVAGKVSSTLVVILLGLAALYAHVNVTLLVATRVVGPLPAPRPLGRYTFAVPRDGAATRWGLDA